MLNVFTPKEAIRSPAKFVGRQKALESMIDGLLTRGADIAVFGERGCGKSSLAHMLQHVASGNTELLDYYGLREQLERRGLLAALIFDAVAPGTAALTVSGTATGPGGTAMGLQFRPATVTVQQ